jgi:hypothetical protein
LADLSYQKDVFPAGGQIWEQKMESRCQKKSKIGIFFHGEKTSGSQSYDFRIDNCNERVVGNKLERFIHLRKIVFGLKTHYAIWFGLNFSNASFVETYNATSSPVRFEDESSFFGVEKKLLPVLL